MSLNTQAADAIEAGAKPKRHSPPYKALLEKVLPLAVACNDEQRALLAEVAAQLAQARENQRARQASDYRRNPEAYKARAKAHREPNAARRARYQQDGGRRRAKGREYAAKRRATGKAQEYAEVIKKDGRNRMYQARYKFGEFAEAALVLYELEGRINPHNAGEKNV